MQEDIDKKIKSVWTGIMKRTKYNKGNREKYKIYWGCDISTEFQNFEFFKSWYKSQQGFDKNFVVDKDLLVKGNRTYAPDRCILIPAEINVALTASRSCKSNLPLGVTYHRPNSSRPYRVRCRYCENGKRERIELGYYKTVEDAFEVYKKFKESYAKRLAEKWKESISKTAYNALMSYTIEITD